MRQDREPDQMDVVCKITPTTPGEMEALQLPRLAPELSCCLQDGRRRGRRAKPVRRNVLSPELRCCLQDGTTAVSGRGISAADGSSPWLLGAPACIVSSNRDCGRATYADCPGILRGIRDPRRSSVCGSQCAGAADNSARCRPCGETETSTAGSSSDNSGNAFHP